MSDFERARDAGFDDWLDAIEDDKAYYLECENGHATSHPVRSVRTVAPRTSQRRSFPNPERLRPTRSSTSQRRTSRKTRPT